MTNFVLIVADDMRAEMMLAIESVMKMANSAVGISFLNGFNVNPVCCASRASILTGKLSQNTGIYGNLPPIGGYRLFDDSTTIATALKGAGYTTGLIGKYLNGYDDVDASYIAPGWDRWWSITSRGDAYYHYGVSNQGTLKTYGDDPNEYLTDVVARQGERFIATAPEPFFAYITPVAPHKQAIPADRHINSFGALEPWTPKSLNEADVSDKPNWVQAQKPLSEARLNSQKRFRKNMYQTLLALNDLINGVIDALRNRGVLDDTMIVFISDNGYMWGEHRLIGKSVPYLEATRMPMVIRWPGINKPNKKALVSNIDIAPTFADLAGIDFPCDGESLRPIIDGGAKGKDHVFIEHARLSAGDSGGDPQDWVPAFAQVQRENWTYTWLGTEEEELYNLETDPLQIHNISGQSRPVQQEMRALCHDDLVKLPPGMTTRPPQ